MLLSAHLAQLRCDYYIIQKNKRIVCIFVRIKYKQFLYNLSCFIFCFYAAASQPQYLNFIP